MQGMQCKEWIGMIGSCMGWYGLGVWFIHSCTSQHFKMSLPPWRHECLFSRHLSHPYFTVFLQDMLYPRFDAFCILLAQHFDVAGWLVDAAFSSDHIVTIVIISFGSFAVCELSKLLIWASASRARAIEDDWRAWNMLKCSWRRQERCLHDQKREVFAHVCTFGAWRCGASICIYNVHVFREPGSDFAHGFHHFSSSFMPIQGWQSRISRRFLPGAVGISVTDGRLHLV